MIEEVHKKFLKWADYVRQPVGDPTPRGYGVNILQRIMEGKGSIMPGAPRGSGPKRLYIPPEALVVENFLKTLPRVDARLIRVFYLSPYWTVEKRAEKLKMPVRTLYERLDRIHYTFAALQRSD